MKGKKKKRKRRKIHPLWKLLICLLLIGSMAMCIQPWLSVKIDTPTGKDKSIEAFLGDAGIDVRYELSNDVAPALRELSDEMYEQTGKRLDAPMAMDLLESLLAGKYAPLGMLRDLERAEALTEQGRTICRLLLFTGSDETRELRDTLDQVDTIVSGAQLGLKILLGAAGLLGAIALLCALTDHRFGLLPYALLSGLLAAGLRAVCTALNSLAASFGLELLDTAELYFPYPTSTLGTDVFRPEPYPAYGAVLALAAFILALATAKRVTAAPAEAAPAAAGAPGEEPVGTAVPPRSTQSPAELPRQTAAAQPRMRPQPAPAGAATEPKRQATGSAARPAERSATGWTCPGCGTRQPDAARYCGVCGTRRPPAAPAAELQGWICPNCGARRGEAERFCSGCGTKRGSAPARAAAPAETAASRPPQGTVSGAADPPQPGQAASAHAQSAASFNSIVPLADSKADNISILEAMRSGCEPDPAKGPSAPAPATRERGAATAGRTPVPSAPGVSLEQQREAGAMLDELFEKKFTRSNEDKTRDRLPF